MEEKGGVVRPPFLHGFAGGATHKHGVMAEMAFHFRITVFPLAHGHPVDDFHVLVLLIIPHQRVHQDGGLIGRMAEKDPGTIGDLPDGFLRRLQLGSVESFPIFHVVYLLKSL